MKIAHAQPRRHKKYTPIIANGPLKILHMDITIFKTTNGVKHYIYVIKDNFSRAILACNASVRYCSAMAKQTLMQVLDEYNLTDKEGTLVTDNGSENRGAVTQWLDRPGNLWKKIIAQVDIVQSNSMVEAANRLQKYSFLYRQPVADTEALNALISTVLVTERNRPLKMLHGLTPSEVLSGAVADKARFQQQIAVAKAKRIAANKTHLCSIKCET